MKVVSEDETEKVTGA